MSHIIVPGRGSNPLDLTGQRFNRFVAVEYAGNSHWRCVCDCGSTRVIKSSHLRGGVRKSCGCLVRTVKGLEGKVVGKLTVVRQEPGQKWLCRCECGNTKLVLGSVLKRTKSQLTCGCYHDPDFIGFRVGRLVVVEKLGRNFWRCQCDCGNAVEIIGKDLVRTRRPTSSCGCLLKDWNRETKTIHGQARKGETTGAWMSWSGAKERCTKPDCGSYPNYGGRGITMYPEWVESFESFYSFMGDRPEGFSLERLDCNGDYVPGNVIWADGKTQARNKRSSRRIEWRGETKTLAEWVEITGLPRTLIRGRLDRGLSSEEAFTLPPKSQKKRGEGECRHSTTKEIWTKMIRRCTNPKDGAWSNYGGRGIQVCDRWFDYENFLADMGERVGGLTLERLDVNKGYLPDNCAWVPASDQHYNKRTTIRVFYDGENRTLPELSALSGIPAKTLKGRLAAGWSVERMLTTPVKRKINGVLE